MTGPFTLMLMAVDLPFRGTVVAGKSAAVALRGVFPVLGAVLLIFLLFVLWARFIRKKKDRSRESHPVLASTARSDDENGHGHHHHRRRRKRRRDHRPRNPTLAETGGLPPVSDKGPTRP
ncbi:MAG: hypothetical protein HYY24_16585 [Verrucomicrobia bacterium]|nr:hypothetical protein [Verrucomicrobiota bacterium]